jgi:hypothetical protein
MNLVPYLMKLALKIQQVDIILLEILTGLADYCRLIRNSSEIIHMLNWCHMCF